MAKTPDKLEAGMIFCSPNGNMIYMLVYVADGGEKLGVVYLNMDPTLSLSADGTKSGVNVEVFVGGDKYLGKIDCRQLKLKLKLKELINDEEE